MNVARSDIHGFSKNCVDAIEIVAGRGVKGDAHAGATVQHRSRVAIDPAQPNLRQVHLIHAELLDELEQAGFAVEPGQLGENILTRGLALLELPRGTILAIGEAELEVTGLRNPCAQIDAFRPGLLKQVARKRTNGSVERRAGIMCVAIASGTVQAGDLISVSLPAGEAEQLLPV